MINKLENWREITKGLYRYVVAANCCYEIHVMYHAKETDILTAKNVEQEQDKDDARFHQLLNTMFSLCELADFHIEGRVVLKDKRTGKVWR